jgi:hypothetical protein
LKRSEGFTFTTGLVRGVKHDVRTRVGGGAGGHVYGGMERGRGELSQSYPQIRFYQEHLIRPLSRLSHAGFYGREMDAPKGATGKIVGSRISHPHGRKVCPCQCVCARSNGCVLMLVSRKHRS